MRCKELAIKTTKKKDFPDEDVIELTVPYGGKDLKILVIIGEEVIWVRDVDEKGEAGDGVILRLDEHKAFDKPKAADTEPVPEGPWKPPVERPLRGIPRIENPTRVPRAADQHLRDSTPSDCGERGGGNQPPDWKASEDPAYLASVAALAPRERIRRTEDGTYPNVGEELSKLDERSRAGYGKASSSSECNFDPELPPEHPHNREVAQEKKVRFSVKNQQYVDDDGCAIYDKFGQKL